MKIKTLLFQRQGFLLVTKSLPFLCHISKWKQSLFLHDPDAQSPWGGGSRLGTRTASWTALKAEVQRDTGSYNHFSGWQTLQERGSGDAPGVRSAAPGIRRVRLWPGRTLKLGDLSLGWDWSRPSRQSRE